MKICLTILSFCLGRINDDETPKALEMEQDDVIEVYQEQTGGGPDQQDPACLEEENKYLLCSSNNSSKQHGSQISSYVNRIFRFRPLGYKEQKNEIDFCSSKTEDIIKLAPLNM